MKMDLDVIYNEDCLTGMDRIPDKSIDMILCDLPYGTTRKNEWDSLIPFDKLWVQYKRVIKSGGAILLTCQIPFAIDVANSNREWLRYEWIWEKISPTGFLNANRMPMKCHENILVFYDILGKYNPQGTVYGKKQSCGGCSSNYDSDSNYAGGGTSWGMKNFPRDVLRYERDPNSVHPTQKPVALFEYLIRTYTDEGDTVLDNCMGSGTTAVACIRSGRHYIGFETDEGYCKIANERISKTRAAYENNLGRWL